MPLVFGDGALGLEVATDDELEAALETVRRERSRVAPVKVAIQGREPSPGLAR